MKNHRKITTKQAQIKKIKNKIHSATQQTHKSQLHTFGNPTNPQKRFNYIMYPNNILFNRKNALSKILTKHINFSIITS